MKKLRRCEQMFKDRMPNKIKQILLLLTSIMLFATAASAGQPSSAKRKKDAEESAPQKPAASSENRSALRNYRGENGILSAKTILFGGMFRVTTVIPFKGDFAEYHRLEITKPISLVGKALKPEAASEQAAKFKSQFESRKLFESVSIIDSYDPAVDKREQLQATADIDNVDKVESLDAPIGSFDDMTERDKRRELREKEERQTGVDKTIVAVIEVIDYAKGRRWKQSLPLDLGKSVLTVRLRYYDKSTGEEIGRQIISGQSDGSSLFGPFEPRNALSGVADGFVDQVTRRVAASER